MFKKLRQIWPLALSATMGFLLAAFLFIPRAYSSNQNVYKILREKINVLQQIISYVNHFYFDTVDMDKVMEADFFGLMELSLIHILDPMRPFYSLYAVFGSKKKNTAPPT